MPKALIVATVSGFLPQFESNNVKILQEYGYEVHFAANFDVPIYDMDTGILREHGIHLHPIGIERSPTKLLQNARVIRQVRQLIDTEGIDLVHCHTPLGGVVARLAAHLSRRKPLVIYTAHGFHFYRGAPLFNWLCYYPAERFLARFTDCIITINREDWKRSKKFHLKPGGRCYQIPGVGIHLTRFHPDGRRCASIRKQLHIPEEGFHIVNAAELNENKNQSVIIQAIAMLRDPDIYCSICGKGLAGENLQEQIAACGLEKQVKLLGYRKDMENILPGADCFAFPSYREGLGMAALEALACEVPVIAAENRGTREYMIDGLNGYICDPDDAASFAAAIRRMKEGPARRARMGESGRRTAVKFSISETDQVMRKIYQEMLGR
jgi:glycosyltransferase involved in cell wall biosynthesis